MIFLRIVSRCENSIEAIAQLLLEEKLVIDVNFKRHIERAELIADKLVCTRVFLLTAKTKASLFSKIDRMLNERFKTNLPEIYALPIVEMDWEQSKQINTELKKKRSFAELRQAVMKMRRLK